MKIVSTQQQGCFSHGQGSRSPALIMPQDLVVLRSLPHHGSNTQCCDTAVVDPALVSPPGYQGGSLAQSSAPKLAATFNILLGVQSFPNISDYTNIRHSLSLHHSLKAQYPVSLSALQPLGKAAFLLTVFQPDPEATIERRLERHVPQAYAHCPICLEFMGH
ncbi:uncharacterized protein EHS24_008062 [Apiotrichum porosum]|uniref:Uncharacterized protein n=1 Tax=Apiotrichum porosum TaxID=105984 RepID=A0A427XSS1_9TREE|nr:uncharacterized protein EHS24_008062 [Apiotrichum porosum]RSH81867.1 hypothetical protein EHS24_008062 [Apiotrichum porosum]